MKRGRLIAVSAVVIALFSASGPVTAATSNAATTTRISQYLPVAGSSRALVYELVQAGSSQTATGTCPPYAGGCQPQELITRDAQGNETTLADLTTIDVALMDWSLAGRMLTAIRSDDDTDVFWWNLDGAGHGELTVPSGSYVAAGPAGVVYLKHGGRLSEMDTSGASSALVHLSTGRLALHGTSDRRGVVVSRLNGNTVYVPFAKPKGKITLSARADCWALSAKYAACTSNGNAAERPNIAELIALDGSKTLRFGKISTRRERFGPVALHGSRTLVWQTFRKNADRVLTCQATNANHAVAGHRPVAFGVEVSALGKVVSASKSGHKLVAATTCPKSTVLASDSRSGRRASREPARSVDSLG